MKSLSSCVQEFIDHHSSTLFSSDNTTDTRRPRFKRFNSSSSSVEIEQEDPSLFAITPPIEYFLHASPRLRREEFFKLVAPGHLLICHVVTASARDMLVRILCFDDGHRRALHDLKLTATCLLHSPTSKHNNYYRRRSKFDRDVQNVSDEDHDDGEYQSGDFIRACVSHVDAHKEEVHLTIDPSLMNQHNRSSKRLGVINEDEFPKHYVLLCEQEEEPHSYEDILQTSKAINNRACVQTLYQRLRTRFEYFSSDDSVTTTNDILYMTLIKSFKKRQIPAEEYFDKLRQRQDREWAIESVAEGIRLMKENDANSAVLHFNKALSTDPKCVDAFVARGALSANQGHYKRAIQDFEGALEINPKHVNASKYLQDVLHKMANETEDCDEAIHYLEKALKNKPDDSEALRRLDSLRMKKKEIAKRLEYGPSLPSTSSSSSKNDRLSRSPKKRKSSTKGSSSKHDRSKRRRSSSSSSTSSDTTTSSSRSSSSSSSTSSSNSMPHSISTISSSPLSDITEYKKPKEIPLIDISESTKPTTTQKASLFSSTRSISDEKAQARVTQSTSNEYRKNGDNRFDTNTQPSIDKTSLEQRKSLPATNINSSIKGDSSSSANSNRSLITDREAEDIERLYMELKAKKSLEKQKK